MLSLVPHTDPLLTQAMEPFDFNNAPIAPLILAKQLAEVVTQHKALGVSANQLGLPYRVFVMQGYPGKPMYAVFNPRIVSTSPEVADFKEGCLSYPDLAVKIRRPISIRVRFQGPNAEIVTETFKGIHARIFQHEMSHMDGKIFYDEANFLNRNKALKDWKNLQRKR